MSERYAAKTEVPADRSRGEIERILTRYGADQFMYGWDDARAVIRFRAMNRMVEFLIPMPDRQSEEFWKTPTGRRRPAPEQAMAAWEQATRQRWRALKLMVQAKLEAVAAGITTFDEEFLAHLLLPDGATVGSFMLPQVTQAYLTGRMPSMLALPERGEERP